MAATHAIEDCRHEGFAAVRLVSPDGLAATWVPRAGMVCASLTHRGEELLGQRRGLAAYAEHAHTMGMPLLYPWANRLARPGYEARGLRVDFPPDSPLVHDDGQGLPIHGLIAGHPGWTVGEAVAHAGAARLTASLDFAAAPDLLALFPFPHVVAVSATLARGTLAVATSVRATGRVAVPVAFGWHPYFRLPGVPRAQWTVALPVRRHMELDARTLPTGRTRLVSIPPGPLGDTVYDDLYVALGADPSFRLAGGGRTLTVVFGSGYPVAVVYAPGSDDVVCFEPMTAPTNPFAGNGPATWVEPGGSFTATFHVVVS
jgi:aldose 1-epimerase